MNIITSETKRLINDVVEALRCLNSKENRDEQTVSSLLSCYYHFDLVKKQLDPSLEDHVCKVQNAICLAVQRHQRKVSEIRQFKSVSFNIVKLIEGVQRGFLDVIPVEIRVRSYLSELSTIKICENKVDELRAWVQTEMSKLGGISTSIDFSSQRKEIRKQKADIEREFANYAEQVCSNVDGILSERLEVDSTVIDIKRLFDRMKRCSFRPDYVLKLRKWAESEVNQFLHQKFLKERQIREFELGISYDYSIESPNPKSAYDNWSDEDEDYPVRFHEHSNDPLSEAEPGDYSNPRSTFSGDVHDPDCMSKSPDSCLACFELAVNESLRPKEIFSEIPSVEKLDSEETSFSDMDKISNSHVSSTVIAKADVSQSSTKRINSSCLIEPEFNDIRPVCMETSVDASPHLKTPSIKDLPDDNINSSVDVGNVSREDLDPFKSRPDQYSLQSEENFMDSSSNVLLETEELFKSVESNSVEFLPIAFQSTSSNVNVCAESERMLIESLSYSVDDDSDVSSFQTDSVKLNSLLNSTSRLDKSRDDSNAEFLREIHSRVYPGMLKHKLDSKVTLSFAKRMRREDKPHAMLMFDDHSNIGSLFDKISSCQSPFEFKTIVESSTNMFSVVKRNNPSKEKTLRHHRLIARTSDETCLHSLRDKPPPFHFDDVNYISQGHSTYPFNSSVCSLNFEEEIESSLSITPELTNVVGVIAKKSNSPLINSLQESEIIIIDRFDYPFVIKSLRNDGTDVSNSSISNESSYAVSDVMVARNLHVQFAEKSGNLADFVFGKTTPKFLNSHKLLADSIWNVLNIYHSAIQLEFSKCILFSVDTDSLQGMVKQKK